MAEANEPTAVTVSTESMERFFKTFERSAKRWEFVVYPALFAFIVLAGYGFFLIYSLTSDMHRISQKVDPRMGENLAAMSRNMNAMSGNLSIMTKEVASMAERVHHMADKMESLDNIAPMLTQMEKLDQSIRSMAVNTHMMRHDMGSMSQNVSRPMSMMNTFMPW